MNIVESTRQFVQETLGKDATAHDFPHTERVVRNALLINQNEGGDAEIIQLGALLHDIADWKFHDGDKTAGPTKAREWLESQKCDAKLVDRVVRIIETVSYHGHSVLPPCLEGRIVQDADRLDALGAIGIARCFAFGGHKGRLIFDESEMQDYRKPSPEEYAKADRSSITHFYDKLLGLQYTMNTVKGRQMAVKRTKFIQDYLDNFFAEWRGDAED